MKTEYIIAIVAIIVALVIIFLWASVPPVVGEYDDFAKCLTDSGATLYGTDTCRYCNDQKQLFGTSFTHVNYVNCQSNRQACNNAGISAYPTWVINGSPHRGVQSLSRLAELTGCSL